MTKRKSPDEICTHPPEVKVNSTASAMPIYPASVYQCDSIDQAGGLLTGEIEGFVYQRDGHPNAVALAEQCRELHGGDELDVKFAHITSTGMSALSLAIVSHLKSGDHVLLSDQLYGRTTRLVSEELTRWGLEFSQTNMCELNQVVAAIRPKTRMLVTETIANPLLHVSDLSAISDIAHSHDAKLLVDNTFATPLVARPFEMGADLVMESMTKMMNGHGDVMMGLLCGKADLAERAKNALSSWGMTASPFDCWLAARGLATAELRVTRANENAAHLSALLSEHPRIKNVYYPGLASHPTHKMAQQVLGGDRFGSMLSIEFSDGASDVDLFIKVSQKISFCPSLGEIATTISHPRSTSHRGLSDKSAQELGISAGLMRISCASNRPNSWNTSSKASWKLWTELSLWAYDGHLLIFF